jgi:hypothetical protein
MKRKRHAPTTAEALLAGTVGVLEDDTYLNSKTDVSRPELWMPAVKDSHNWFVMLLRYGPFNCDAAVVREERRDADAIPPAVVTKVRAELLLILRNAVQVRDRGDVLLSLPRFATPSIEFSSRIVDGQPRVAAEGTSRDLLVLQLVTLLQEVGLEKVRRCEAPDCGRLYVKTHKQKYCRPRCQRRINARQQRRKERKRLAKSRLISNSRPSRRSRDSR